MNFTGLIAGIITLFIIGLGFVWVIKLDYFVGPCSRRVVLFIGIITMFSTYFITDFMPAALVGIIAGSIIWGSTEMQDQEGRAKEGQFPYKEDKLCNKITNSRFSKYLNGKEKNGK